MLKKVTLCTIIFISTLIAGWNSFDGLPPTITRKQEFPYDLPLLSDTLQDRDIKLNRECRREKDILLRSVEEFLIDTNRVFLNARGDQGYPSVAFDGINYLVVWADDRGYEIGLGVWAIYCARITQTGILLDSSGILVAKINDATANQGVPEPTVAFDGTNYLIVWHDIRTEPLTCDIIGARVTPSGVVSDPNGIEISTAPNSQLYQQVAFDGVNFFVVWEDLRDGNWNIYGARVNQSGAVLDPNGIAISTQLNHQFSPSVAFDGTNYLIAWEDWRNGNADIYGSRVTPTGIVLDPNGIPISIAVNHQKRPQVTFGGFNYLVAWFDDRDHITTYFDIYGARVNQSGIVLDPNGIAISTEMYAQAYPAVTFDGTNYFVVWHDWRSENFDVYGARVDQFGIVLDPAGIAVSTVVGGQGRPAVAFDGTNYLVAWHDNRSMYNGDGFDIYGARISQSGAVLDPEGILVTIEIFVQFSSSVAFDGYNFFVVWQDFRNGTFANIYGCRIDLSGKILDPLCIPISTAAFVQKSPIVTFGQINFLVVYEDTRNGYAIYGTRVDTDGSVLDPEGFPISVSAEFALTNPTIMFGSSNYFIIWETTHDGNLDIHGARVTPDGLVLDPGGIVIAHGAKTESRPAVAFDGINYFVVWEDHRDYTANPPDIYGSRINQSGEVLDPGGFAISMAVNSQGAPSIAFDGTSYLIVW